MTDRAAPKAKKPAKGKDAAKAPGPKLVDKTIKPGVGHNGAPTGEKNPEAIKLLNELMDFQKQKKSVAKAEGAVRNRLRTEFGILASSVAREVALRKLDPDVRVQVETNHEDFKKMVGYQPSLDFQNGVATTATQKAVAPEEKVRDTEPTRAPAGKKFFDKKPKAEVEQDDDKVEFSDEQEESEEGANVIEREG